MFTTVSIDKPLHQLIFCGNGMACAARHLTPCLGADLNALAELRACNDPVLCGRGANVTR